MSERRWRLGGVCLLLLMLTGCISSPPQRLTNACHIFDEKKGWYKDARKSQDRWGVPVPVMLAFMYQESRFQAKAKPPRRKILWVIPGPRLSNAYGYSQAKKETWEWYKREAGGWGADRDDFGDAIDFIGWYNHTSHRRNKIAKNDAYRLYLAYHEGHGGYARGSYRRKPWLQKVARKVADRSATYTRQLQGCEKRLQRSGWWPFW
ncbi:MAG: transglycosylase SLT domain-containing protein [Gammaproteobacteria bacterium]|nr:transglycosylase SLT domain-containing protein [Gammaproteobacteria bacterium]